MKMKDAATLGAFCLGILNSRMKLSMSPRNGGFRVAIYFVDNQRLLAEGFHESDLVAAFEEAISNLRKQYGPEAA